jgi:hypothetical protein
MGGQSGSRGYIYQGIVSIFESLQNNDWNKIHVEYSTPNDKVDIAMVDAVGTVIRSIQVKSSINQFSKSDIINWINALIGDAEAKEYQLYLIGACDVPTNKFIKSVGKFYAKQMDEEAESSLASFSQILLEHSITVSILPFDEDSLLGVIRDKMHRYISQKGYTLDFTVLEQLSYAVLSMQMLLGTKGNYITKDAYDQKIVNWISCSADGALKKQGHFSQLVLLEYDQETKKFPRKHVL